MKKATRQKLSMYKAVLEVCKTHETDWAEIAGFVAAVNNLETAISIMDSKAQLQASKTVGVMANKIDKIEAAIELLMILHGALEMHGSEIGDAELRLRNKKTLTALKRLDNTRLNVQFNQIIGDLALYGNALTPYGITPEFVTESLVLIEEARISLSRPRMAIIERKGYTNSLDIQTVAIDDIIKLRLDKMMRLFKKTQPEFFDLYSNARMVIDLGSRPTSSESPTIPTPDEPDDGL
jgi:hypothetical protein